MSDQTGQTHIKIEGYELDVLKDLYGFPTETPVIAGAAFNVCVTRLRNLGMITFNGGHTEKGREFLKGIK